MSSTDPTTRRTDPSPRPRERSAATPLPAALLGALLALAVAVIHVMDQGGLTALKDPAYIGYGYWLLEVVAVVTAVLLLARRSIGWLLALGVAAGPFLGFVLTRTTGLPDATDDIGNWGETLGVVSLVVEAVLFVLAAWMLSRTRRP